MIVAVYKNMKIGPI